MAGCFLSGAIAGSGTPSWAEGRGPLIPDDSLAEYVAWFNAGDDERVTNAVANAVAFDWLSANIPRFACPDPEVEAVYYFRWWSYRKHLRQTPQGFVVTEFLAPVRHAGEYNTISCAVGHHLAEGRWLHDPQYLDDDVRYWLRGNAGKPPRHLHAYSNWLAAAVWERFRVTGDGAFVLDLLDDLVADYQAWEAERLLPDGLFWQYDVRDGMEESISGSRTARQARPTINSYQYGNARAIAALARLAGRPAVVEEFGRKAETLRRLVQERLWDPTATFFKVRREDGTLADVREAIGFVPWAFGLPEAGRGFEVAWAQFADPTGFRAPFGLTTAERRDPRFRSHGCCGCEWDGAVWPFATSQALVALANLLRIDATPRDHTGTSAEDNPETGPRVRGGGLPVSRADYFEAFLTYTRSHRFDGRPYLGEYLDETTGQWLKGRQERSRHYNHSTYADLLITGVIGLCPREDNRVEVDPLLPEGTWDWFCLEGVKYHGRMLTLVWDRDGSRFGRGAGFQVWVDGRPFLRSDRLGAVTGELP